MPRTPQVGYFDNLVACFTTDRGRQVRLVSREARRVVEAGVGRFLRQFLQTNPEVAEAVFRAATGQG